MEAEPKLLEGQKALVTGASSGIGKAVAMADAGAEVVVNYVAGDDDAAAAVVGEIRARGGRARASGSTASRRARSARRSTGRRGRRRRRCRRCSS